MMRVQMFLRGGGTLKDLEEVYAINIKRHQKYNNLVLLKYDQIDSPMNEKLVHECRGLILDESKDWEIICHPFDKFFNYGEGPAAEIDWGTAKFQEKLDGSLCTLYWYKGEWHVATSGTPDASGKINDTELTFKDLFWQVFEEECYDLPFPFENCFNFMFELMTKHNRIVVHHPVNKLRLIGMRNIGADVEYNIEQYHIELRTPFKKVEVFPLQTMDQAIESFNKIDPVRSEGYVVVDATFNRIKVKHPGYVALHQMKDSIVKSKRAIVEVVRRNETSEFLTYFPEYREEFEDCTIRYHLLQQELLESYEKIKNIPVQKDFALEAVKTKCSGALFMLRSNKVDSIPSYLREMRIENLMDILGL